MNKNIIALGSVSFFTDMATAMITPLIPIVIVLILHQDVATLGVVVAIATFVSYAFRILFGYLGDRWQITKPFVVAGYLISAIVKPLFYFAGSWQSVAALQASERLGKAVRSPSKDCLISTFAKKNQSGRTFGFHKMMDIAGELCGALIVFAVLAHWGQSEAVIKNLFAFTAIPGVIAVFIVLFFVDDAPYRGETSGYQWNSEDSQLLPLMALYFFFLLFIFSSSFMVVRASDNGYSTAVIPLLFVVLNLTQTLTSYYFGVVIDKLGEVRVLIFALLAGLLTQLCLYFGLIGLSFILLGLFTVSSLNVMRSYIAHHSHNQATVFGIFYGGSALFSALGALLVGALWDHFGAEKAMLVSIAGSGLIVAVLTLFKTRIKSR